METIQFLIQTIMILLKKFSQIKLFQFIRVFQLLKSQAKTLNFNPLTKELGIKIKEKFYKNCNFFLNYYSIKLRLVLFFFFSLIKNNFF
jgi:hypothetical protein